MPKEFEPIILKQILRPTINAFPNSPEQLSWIFELIPLLLIKEFIHPKSSKFVRTENPNSSGQETDLSGKGVSVGTNG